MQALWIYLALGIYIVVGTLLAFWAGRGMGRGVPEYFLANRTLGGIVSALTYSATTYSAFMMVGLAGLMYSGGVGAFGFEIIYLSGLVLAAFFGPRFWLAGKRFGYISPAELLADRYDSRWVGFVVAAASCLFLIPYSAVQLMGISYLLEGLSGGAISYTGGLVVAVLLALLWASIAGLRSVAWTDSLQALIMILASVLTLLVVVYGSLGGFGGLFSALENQYPELLTVKPKEGFFNLKAFIGLTIPWFFFCISNPQVSQRLFMPASLTAMRRMIGGFLAFGFVYTLVSVLWGLSARVLFPGLDNPDMATPTLLASDAVPAVLALVVMVGITAAAISTIDSILLTLSSMVARDIFRALRPRANEESELRVGKVVLPLIAALAFLFAHLKLGLISILSVAASAGLLVMVPAIFGAFFWRRGTAAGALASIVIAGAATTYLQFTGLKPLGMWPGFWALVLSTLLFVVVSLLTRPPTAKAALFLGYLSDALKKHRVL